MRSMTSHLNFDLELAKKQSDENPVFYLQYAHARISSILRMTKEENLQPSLEHLELLSTDTEQDLLKRLFEFPEVVLISAENYEVHKIANYLEELASSFHKFYTECRIIGSEKNLAEARISLAVATQIVLKNGLSILGVSAPERMTFKFSFLH
jgi:arginyl-tRNA synthetase